jgi:Protein of unknown function (DUF1573)
MNYWNMLIANYQDRIERTSINCFANTEGSKMRKMLYLFRSQIAVIMLIILWTAMKSSAATGAKADFEIGLDKVPGPAPRNFDFGKFASGQTVQRTMSISNKTGVAIVLEAKANCGCLGIEIAQPALRDGESTEAHLSLNTTGKRGTGGELENDFLLVDTLHAGPPLFAGKIRTVVTQSVTSSVEQLTWRVQVTKERKTRELEIENTLDEAVDLNWKKEDDRENYFSISPSEAVLPPHSKTKLQVTLTAETMESQHYVANASATFALAVADTKSSTLAPWSLSIPVEIMPQVPLIAVPGAIIVGPSDFHDGMVTRDIKLMRTLGSDAIIVDVFSQNSQIKVTKKDDGLYSIQLLKVDVMTMDEIQVEYTVDNKKTEFRVPVCVHP